MFNILLRNPCASRMPFVARTMSSAAVHRKKLLYFVYAPDSKDGDRFAVREQHLKDIQPRVAEGVARIGGMMLKPGTDHGAEKVEAHGSILMFEADSLEDVKTLVEKDIYYTSGVWDKEKIVITALKLAINEPLKKL